MIPGLDLGSRKMAVNAVDFDSTEGREVNKDSKIVFIINILFLQTLAYCLRLVAPPLHCLKMVQAPSHLRLSPVKGQSITRRMPLMKTKPRRCLRSGC